MSKIKTLCVGAVLTLCVAQIVSKSYEQGAGSRAENRQFDVQFHNATNHDVVVSQRFIGSRVKKFFSSKPSEKEQDTAITLAPGENDTLHCEHGNEIIHVTLYKGNEIKGKGSKTVVTASNSYNIKDTNRGGLRAEHVKSNIQK